MRNAFPGAVPEIPVSDINKATAYYESSLGFNIDWALRSGTLERVRREVRRMPGVVGLGVERVDRLDLHVCHEQRG